MLRPVLHRLVFVAVATSSLFACGGKQGEAETPEVVLFGHDPGIPKKAPETCKKLGKIEVSVIGKDASPDDALRKEAVSLGANAVTRIKKDGSEEVLLGAKVYYRAQAVLCPDLPKPDPSASAAPTSEPNPGEGWEG